MPRKNKIIIRTGSAAPTASDFVAGEPAWDSTNGKLYIRNAAGTMVEIAGGGGGGTTELVYTYATTADLPATGDAAKLYITTDTSRMYRWVDSTTKYVEVSGVSAYDSRWDLFLPPAPTGVTGTSGNAQVALSWTAPTVSAQTPITSYTVQYSSNSGSTWTTFGTQPTTASVTVTGLANSTSYIFRVSATNAVGAGSYSSASSSITPVAGDSLFSSVALLLHFNGSNGATTFTDSSGTPKTVVRNGTPTISTAQSKFGGASGLFGGSSDYLTVADSSMAVGSGDFTIEAWVYLTSLQSGIRTLWAHRTDSSAAGGALLTHTNGSIRLYICGNTANWQVVDFSPGLTFSANTWQHVALVRDGNTIRTFLDGTQGSTTTVASGAIATSSNFSIMAGTASGGQEVAGYMDEFRLTKAARYTASFTPPSAAFQDN